MTQTGLRGFHKTRDHLIAIDSDGCAFDSMEIKHKECFIPEFIRHFDLQAVSSLARQTAEFVNLYSRSRGTNRFPAYVKVLDLLRERPAVHARLETVPRMDGLRDWLARETRLGTATIEPEADRTGDPDLARAFRWSEAVDLAIAAMVRGVPPFPGVRKALQAIADRADMIVCSATPNAALVAEWNEHALADFAARICGQEEGSKYETLSGCIELGFDPERVLMVGDSPGDLRAARRAGCRFFPINPGREEASWDLFNSESLAKFLNGSYEGAYENDLVAHFEALLPTDPPWVASAG